MARTTAHCVFCNTEYQHVGPSAVGTPVQIGSRGTAAATASAWQPRSPRPRLPFIQSCLLEMLQEKRMNHIGSGVTTLECMLSENGG